MSMFHAKLLPVLLLFLFCLSVGHAITYGSTNATSFVINDSYICLVDTAPNSCNSTVDYSNSTTISVAEFSTAFGIKESRAFFKFTNPDQNKIITDGYFTWETTLGGCNARNKTVYFNPNDTWSDNSLTGKNYPSGNEQMLWGTGLMPQVAGIGVILRNYTSLSFFDQSHQSGLAYLLNDLYSSNATTLETDAHLYRNGAIDDSCGTVTGTVNGVASEKLAGHNPPQLNLTLADYFSSEILGTGVSTVYFDFEAGIASRSSFPQADFKYDSSTNTITPLVATMRFDSTMADSSNTLNLVSCRTAGGFGTGASIPSLSSYDTYCFNLSAHHSNNRAFYGAIKVVNNTGGNFDFYYALYSPNYVQFTNILLSPTQPQRLRNVQVSWKTSMPLTSALYYRYYDLGKNQWSDYVSIADATIASQHSLVIPAENVTFVNYQYYLEGSDGVNIYQSDQQSFTTGSYVQTYNDITSGITVTVQNQEQNPVYNAFVVLTPFPTPQQVTTQNVFATDNTTLLHTYSVATFTFIDPVDNYGLHNVTVTADGFQNFNGEINVTTDPYFYLVTLTPNTCVRISETKLNDSCVANMNHTSSYWETTYNLANVTSWACSFNAAGCTSIDANGNKICGQSYQGSYTAFGTYVGYVCFGNITYQNVINGTVPSGQNVNTGAAGAFTDPFAMLLGWSTESSLNFFAMLITLLITLGAGILTRDGLVAGIIFISSITMFAFVGWLPVWVWILLTIADAFIIGRYVAKSFTPA